MGCNVCKYTGWLEILAVEWSTPMFWKPPASTKKYTGFAFGMGIERIAM